MDPISWTGAGYDRGSERRDDEDWLEKAWDSPRARVLVLAGTRVHVVAREGGEGPEWVSPQDAPPGLRLLLGEEDGRVSFAVIADPELAQDRREWATLREIAPLMRVDEAQYVVHAVGIAEWHWAVRCCPRCGAALGPKQAGHVLQCTSCGRQQFPRTDPAVIMLITDDQDRALLGRQPSWPQGRWSTLAGFVEPGESLEDAVRREVREEAGVVVGEVAYLGSQPWPLPSSLMLGFRGRALDTTIEVDHDELEAARWWSREEARAAAEDGTLLVPPGISISRSLILDWYGSDLPGSWA